MITTLAAERRQFSANLAAMKHEAGRLGLWSTMRALDEATRRVGWEIADIEEGRQADVLAGRPKGSGR